MRDFSLDQLHDAGDQETEAPPRARGLDTEIATEAGPAPPNRSRDSTVSRIIASGVVLMAVIGFGTRILVSALRERARTDAKRELDTTAYIIAEHCEGTFQSVELVQRSAIERMRSLGVASSDDLERLMSGFDAHLMLKDMVSGVPQLDALILVDPGGKLVSSSRDWPMPDAVET